MPTGAKSLLVDRDPQRRGLIKELVNNLGFNTIACCEEIKDIECKPESGAQNVCLIVYAESVSAELIDQLKAHLARFPMPVLLMIDDIEKEEMTAALEAGVTAFISLGVQGNRIKHAVNTAFANFDAVSALHQKVQSLEDRLDNRIVIDKAKGLIMKNRGLDEAQAYEYLRNYAMKKGKKIVDVADMTIATAELLDSDY